MNPSINWAAFDLETHDLDGPTGPRIIELGSAYFRGSSHHTTETLRINPGVPISPKATEIHGITDEDVVGRPMFAQVAPQLAIDHAKDGDNTIVTYNGRRFDIPATIKHFAECGIDWQPRTLDVYDFVNWHLRHMRNRKLVDLCQHYGIPLENAHSAGDDAEAAGLLLLKLQADGIIPKDIGEAIALGNAYAPRLDKEWERFRWYIYIREDGIPRIGYGKHIGVQLAEVDRGFLGWALRTNDQERDLEKKMPAEVVALFRNPRMVVEPS